ncbi:MAG: RT0821/Lpp0805 family surface protein [Pseudomonadota bacterium]
MTLSGCAGGGPRESSGGLIGAAAGGLVGSQFGGGKGQIAAAVIGALAGAALGREIGRDLDAKDRASQRRATSAALETIPNGESLPWRNPDSGNNGRISPTRTYERGDGRYCREFTQDVTVGGRSERAYGTACREPDGTWRIVG